MAVGEAAGETPSLKGEVVGETYRGLECAQAHPLGNQHQEGPNLIVGSGRERLKSGGEWSEAIAPSRPLPHVQHHSAATSVTLPW